MGSGKSTVGKVVAQLSATRFIDLDDYIGTREGMSVPEIFSNKGELYFRKKELEYLKEVLAMDGDVVLATGGGTPCYGNNVVAMLSATKNVFYLKHGLPQLVERLKTEKEQRPLIKNVPDAELMEFIGKHLFERSFFYNQAPHKIACKAKTPEHLAQEILEKSV